MWCDVIRLLISETPSGDRVERRPAVRGRIDYSPRLRHDEIRLTVFTAYLSDEDGNNLLPPLDAAVLLKIDNEGILLGGAAVYSRTGGRNSRTFHTRQAWLISPIPNARAAIET